MTSQVTNLMANNKLNIWIDRLKKLGSTLIFNIGAAAWKVVNQWGNSTLVYEVGEYTYGVPRVLYPRGNLKIGKFCSIAQNVTIFLGGNHRLDWISLYPFEPTHPSWPDTKGTETSLITKGDVTIGNDVWIGSGATIMSGVSVGDGAAIGTGSVVTSDVDPYSVVAGNPAKVIKMRFSEEDIARLLEIKWWDWPEDMIRRSIGVLCSGDVDKLEEISRLPEG